jgi:hypothetical protein
LDPNQVRYQAAPLTDIVKRTSLLVSRVAHITDSTNYRQTLFTSKPAFFILVQKAYRLWGVFMRLRF